MIAIDTNILVYAEGIGDGSRIAAAQNVLGTIPNKDLVFPLQALAQLTHVLARKTILMPSEIRTRVDRWTAFGQLAPTMGSTFTTATTLASEQHFQIFDAIILAAAAEAGCHLLLSEDMQDGFVWRGVTVANPFAATLHPLLSDALRG